MAVPEKEADNVDDESETLPEAEKLKVGRLK